MKIDRLFLGILIGGGAAVLLSVPFFNIQGLSQPWATVFSSFVALVAACIAYSAATAKVRFDRAQDEKNRAERQHNLLVRLLYAIRAAERDIDRFGNETSGGAPAILTLEAAKKINLPREIPIIWENAGLLPVPIADAVGEMMEVYAEIEDFKDMLKAGAYSDSERDRIRKKMDGLMFRVSCRTDNIITKINADLNTADPNRESLQSTRALFD